MNVMYCGDANIERGVFISVLSLLRNSQDTLHVYLLTAGFNEQERTYSPLSDAFARRLRIMVQEHDLAGSVELIDITNRFLEDPPMANMDTRFSPCCMLRLYADEVAGLPDKILYLDNDVVCRSDCSVLFDQDMDGFEVAGVLDYYGRWFFRNNALHLDYLNSGVLLMNIPEIRRTSLFQKCRRMCASKKMFMPDQSAINSLATSKKILPRHFNEQRQLQSDTVLQHFTTSFRFFPWLRIVSVKPWNVNEMHQKLKLHEYDDILSEYEKRMPQSTGVRSDNPTQNEMRAS